MTETFKNAAPKILELIKASNSILLHCHPSPDGDSIGSALAMKFALEQLGKKPTVIRGDNEIPDGFKHLPGIGDIIPKNFFEIDLSQFDLFIVQDSSIDRVSKIGKVVIPPSLKTVLIDHHISNVPFAGPVDIVDPTYPATALLLCDLFKAWSIALTPEIAANLFIGSFTDTGGFKYSSVTTSTFAAIADITHVYPDFHDLVFKMENSTKPAELAAVGLALSRIETFMDGHVALSCVSLADLREKNISEEDVSTRWVTNMLKSVVGWDVCASVVEIKPEVLKVSFSTRDPSKYDLSVIAASLGGGGHKAAAGVVLSNMTLDDAKKKIVAAVSEYVDIKK